MRNSHITGSSRRGFTLIELMITVVILGVLAALAVLGVSSYMRSAKTSEAAGLIVDMMAGQVRYKTEAHRFLDVSGGVAGDGDYYPNGSFDGTSVIMWGGDDGCSGFGYDGAPVSCYRNFQALGVEPDMAVRFRYSSTVIAAGAGPALPTNAAGYNPGGVTATEEGYIVVAQSDLDGDSGLRTAVVGSSLMANLYMENKGE